jgi:O-antigen/teichoic acid export membrane protein
VNIRNIKIFNVLSQNYLIKAFSFLSLSQVITLFTSFGILTLYTKNLAPSDFGKIALIWIFVLITSTIIDCRLNTAFSIKFYKVSKEENVKNIYSILAYNLIVFFLIYFVFLSHTSLFQEILKIQIETSDLNVIFLLILFMIFGNFYTNILTVSQKPKEYFFVRLLFNIVLIISSVIYLINLKLGYISYLKAYLNSYFIVSLLGLRFILINYKPYKKNIISLSALKELLRLGLPMVPNGLMIMLLIWADRYILNLYVGISIVGIYTIGYKFSAIVNSLIVTPFEKALAPLLFKQFAKSQDEYKKTMRKVFKYCWLIAFTAMMGYFVVLKEVYQLIIDVRYIMGYNIIAIVLFGVVLWMITDILGTTVIMKEKTGKMFLFTSVSALLNIGLNFILIPKYGMYGAAVATLLSYVLQFIIIFTYTQKLLFITYDYKFIFKSCFISLCFFIFILSISYLKIDIITRVGLKIIIFILFILVSYKFLELKGSVRVVLDYVIKSKKIVS